MYTIFQFILLFNNGGSESTKLIQLLTKNLHKNTKLWKNAYIIEPVRELESLPYKEIKELSVSILTIDDMVSG